MRQILLVLVRPQTGPKYWHTTTLVNSDIRLKDTSLSHHNLTEHRRLFNCDNRRIEKHR